MRINDRCGKVRENLPDQAPIMREPPSIMADLATGKHLPLLVDQG